MSENNKITGPNKPPEEIAVPQFWEEIGSDLNIGIEKFVENRKVTLSSTLAAAIVESFNEDPLAYLSFEEPTQKGGRAVLSYHAAGKRSFSNLFRFFWNKRAKIYLGLLILLALGGISYLLAINFIEIKNQVTVKRAGGLPAFNWIEPGDIAEFEQTAGQTSIKVSNLQGRIVLTPIPENAAVTEKDLLRRELSDEMSGRRIFPIPVNPKLVDDSLKPNRKISLTLVKNKEPFGESAIIYDVILLGVIKRETAATIITGLTSDQFTKITPLLGNSEIFINY